MLLGFRDRFVPLVLDGRKRQTIRRRHRWSAGRRADLYRNVRQPSMKLLFRATVTRVADIEIERTRHGLEIHLDGVLLNWNESEELAKADGFVNLHDMESWWGEHHPEKMFEGQVVYWDFEGRMIG